MEREHEVYETCIDGFLAVAKISAHHHVEDVLDDLVMSLCKFITLLNPSSFEEPVLAFEDIQVQKSQDSLSLHDMIASATCQ